jgi:hypothetical protein
MWSEFFPGLIKPPYKHHEGIPFLSNGGRANPAGRSNIGWCEHGSPKFCTVKNMVQQSYPCA